MSSLSIFAGPSALKKIRSDGLSADDFKVLVGASGGPKWFVLYGLDRYLFGEFFANRREELITLGSSSGAWRMCCLGTADPVAAIERLATLYSEETYSAKPTVAEITAKARAMLTEVLGPDGARDIAQNKDFRTHIIAARARGLGASKRSQLQAVSLLASALTNLVSRRSLSAFYERAIFSNMGQMSPWRELRDLRTRSYELTQENLQDVMIASGAIPFILEGVRDIPGASPGLYWDGGITDYHFDMPFHKGPELVLYPHFSRAVIPGWFDKKLKWRNVDESNFHNVVLVTPSKEFVASLPFGKIPDRSDFDKLDADTRLEYWREVLAKSQQMAEDFSALVENGQGLDQIQAFSDR